MNKPLYLVAGLGKTGYSIARYLRRRNLPFVGFDTRKEFDGLSEFISEFPGVDIFLEQIPLTLFSELSNIITSPGISLDEPFIQKAIELNIPVFGDIECLAREVHVPIIGITGTNGKSTVTTLVGEMAKAQGFSVAVAGNIGYPVLDLLDDSNTYDLWVLELSSFQLDLIHSLQLKASTILNISPDHLDRHHTLEAYKQSKQKIYLNAEYVVFNREDMQTYPAFSKQNGALSFGLNASQDSHFGVTEKDGHFFLAKGHEPFFDLDNLRLKGKQNWQNALAACALASIVGIDVQCMVDVLATFNGLPHRCEWIRTLDKVTWINDSKGTNVGATISAISGIGGAMQGKIVLIAGGQGKGADFSELQDCVETYVRSMVLVGEDAEKIEHALHHIVPIQRAENLESAVQIAKGSAKPGDVVLLSPACASLDMFKNFAHRGEVFSHLVRKL